MHLFHSSNAGAASAGHRLIRTVSLLTAAILTLAFIDFGGSPAQGASGLAAVTAQKLTLRASASNRGRSVTVLKKGDIVRVVSSKSTWKRVCTSGGKTGWCQSRYLTDAVYSSSYATGTTTSLDWPSDHINVAQTYTYWRCYQDMNDLVTAYPGLARLETIGTSVMGNPIKAIVLGKQGAGTKVLFQAAIHAREGITALVAMRQAECMLKAASFGGVYKGVNVADLLTRVEIWVVPVANPDGLRLLYEGISSVPPSMPALKAAIRKMNRNSNNFTRWKANARGVDLNRNFEAGWKRDKYYPKPGPFNYPGSGALTEPESVVLRDLTLEKDFALTMSYHSSGKVIYWYNPAVGYGADYFIANNLKNITGYRILSPAAQVFNGGFRDWFVSRYNRPGFTLEIGAGYCPLPQSNFQTYWQETRYVMFDMVWLAAPK